jgi:hypothetical protein
MSKSGTGGLSGQWLLVTTSEQATGQNFLHCFDINDRRITSVAGGQSLHMSLLGIAIAASPQPSNRICSAVMSVKWRWRWCGNGEAIPRNEAYLSDTVHCSSFNVVASLLTGSITFGSARFGSFGLVRRRSGRSRRTSALSQATPGSIDRNSNKTARKKKCKLQNCDQQTKQPTSDGDRTP